MKRKDGRSPGDLRPMEIKAGVVEQADGSAMVRMGRTIAIAAVYGPKELHPRRMQKSDKAFMRTIYRMVPFSTTDRCRPGPNRRSQEISMVIRECLEPAVFLEEFPKKGIYIYLDIIQADAGTRTAAINAASVALADAGIPMRDLVCSAASGKIGKDYFLDLEYKEEEETDADLPIAYMPRSKKVTLLQMDGDMTVKDVKGALRVAIKGCEMIYDMQKQALKDRYNLKAAPEKAKPAKRAAVKKPSKEKKG